MFKHLTDFTHKRTPKEAIGFYLAYFLLNLIIGAALGIVLNQGFSNSSVAGTYGAVLTQLILGALILKSRKLFKSFLYIILVILALPLSYIGGGLLGLIPLAYLTTRNS